MQVAVIGGGASGLSAAIAASARHKVTVFEKNDKVGKKLLATGNGRCNLTNSKIGSMTDNKKFYNNEFAYKIIQAYPFREVISFFDGIGLEVRLDEDGRVYPFTEQAVSVLDVLRCKCIQNGVKFYTGSRIDQIRKEENKFVLISGGTEYVFDKLIFAPGSSVQSKNYNGLELAGQLGLKLTKLSPALCPISIEKPLSVLNGIRIKCQALLFSSDGEIAREDGEILFRNYGISGIAVFNLSSYIARDNVANIKTEYYVMLDLFPDLPYNMLLAKMQRRLGHCNNKNFFVGLLPIQVANEILKYATLKEVNEKNIEKVVFAMKNWKHRIIGLCEEETCQVMSGGIDTAQILPDFSVKDCEGLYVIGEVLDVDGLCGGFNLHFAFISGLIAGVRV